MLDLGFSKLVRYKQDGKIFFGDLQSHTDGVYTIKRLQGDLDQGFQPTGDEDIVKKLLCPLPSTPIVMCVGLNYRHHAEEAKLEVPRDPVVFTKPADALTGPNDDIHIHPDAQSQVDWEGEMTIIIGRDTKNATPSNALASVLGYAIGNDISARNFQVPANVSGGQYCYAKSFDGFAPVGAAIVAPSVIPDPMKLNFTTRVNGEVKQTTCTSDMIWSVGEIIVHLSRGTTLRKGTVIMTGTPSGIGFFAGEFLKDGDVVEVEMEHAGSIRNKIVFD
ncbi:hypothetical protein Q7P36_007022 [Cladosporium allicinum]